MRRLVYQCHVGNNDYAVCSFNSVHHYCKRHRVDYICDTESVKPLWFDNVMTNKFRCLQYLRDYDQVLYLDSDILVLPDAPNIFEEYKDRSFIGARFTVCDQWLHGDCVNDYGPFNGGVLLFNKHRRPWADVNLYNLSSKNHQVEDRRGPVKQKLGDSPWWKDWDIKYQNDIYYVNSITGYLDEQRLLSRVIDDYGISTFHIDRKWNFRARLVEGMHDAYFWHFEGNMKHIMRDYYERLFVGRTIST